MSEDIDTPNNNETTTVVEPETPIELNEETETITSKPITSGWSKILVKPPVIIEEPSTDQPTPEQAVIHVINDDPIIDNDKDEKEMRKKLAMEIEHNLKESLPENNNRNFKFGWVTTDDEFRKLLKQVNNAIKAGINPERIRQGSSGSYFILNDQRKIIGVFKPKTEEPYGHLNPKMMKYFHRTCCPCFFGRSCIIPNTGFLSEAAASVIDRQLGLNVVPRTEIVRLAAPSFHYGYWARMRAKSKNGRFPEKIGSFQTFVENFKEATEVMPQFEASYTVIAPEMRVAFQREFERLVILDYAIRNTDRSMDNWMIHFSWKKIVDDDEEDGEEGGAVSKSGEYAEYEMIPKSTKNRKPIVKIAAIDNGLAFPFKHPDNWRSYPYSWMTLKCASEPFSDQTCAEFIPILSDPNSWDSIIESLRQLFQADPFEYDDLLFEKQMSILRGQLHNILEALIKRQSPLELVQKPLLLIEDQEDFYVGKDGEPTGTGGGDDMLPYARRMKKKEVEKKPWFSFC